ncbi:MAG: ABC transporter ATP-binding protein [Polyangiaceae bacterium]|nr:ABC transporter ATP-binding protein [Polyangiaceae bacterium]
MSTPAISFEQPESAPRSGVRVLIDHAKRFFPGSGLVLDDISLDIAAGSFVALLGPSGCGKSTLLRIIAGLDQADQGTVSLQPPADSGHPRIAYVFQDAHLLPWRTVLENVTLPLQLLGTPKAERRADAMAALAKVGLADAAERVPAELSGGMKMRVSLARALVTRPQILLLDEPFAALDEITRQKLDDQLRALWLEHDMTVLFVTHSNAEAAYLAERCIVLSPRPAKVVLDTPIRLPRTRHASLRAEASFAKVLGPLYDALAKAGAA